MFIVLHVKQASEYPTVSRLEASLRSTDMYHTR